MKLLTRMFTSLIILYILGVFISLEPNVLMWHEISRFVLVFCWVVCCIGVFLYWYIHERNDWGD